LGAQAAGQANPRLVVTSDGTGPIHAGDKVISGRLLSNLAQIQDAAPGASGLSITGYNVTADGQLIASTSNGPRILFGQMITQEQVDTLQAKVDSLKDLARKIDLVHARLEYVNLENPHQPAVKEIPSPRPSPSPAH
jgi:hypothetical protein